MDHLEQSSQLLSLPSVVVDLILKSIASGPPGSGSVQTLLNLRLVSSTTKSWVDEYPNVLDKNCVARVDLSKPNVLDKFLKNPPPPRVTSLYLSSDFPEGTNVKFNVKNKNKKSPDDASWTRFVYFWSSSRHLKSLSIETLSLPLNNRLAKLFASTSIKKFNCQKIISLCSLCSEITSFPPFLFDLEELSIEELGLSLCLKLPLMEQLGANQNSPLRELSVEILEPFDVMLLVILMKNKMGSLKKLHLSMDICQAIWNIAVDPEQPPEILKPTVHFLKIFSPDTTPFRDLEKFNLIRKLAENVEKIRIAETCFLRLSAFPNLKELVCLEDDVEVDVMPEQLERLVFSRGLPPPCFLQCERDRLTSLELKGVECSEEELLASLELIDRMFPNLKNFELNWTWSNGQEAIQDVDKEDLEVIAEELEVDFLETRRFQRLDSLSFTVQSPRTRLTEWAASTQLVLSKGFTLSRLSLRSFTYEVHGKLNGTSGSNIVNEDFVRSLVESQLAKSLCILNIKDEVVDDEAMPLMTSLRKSVAENHKLRRWTFGFGRGGKLL